MRQLKTSLIALLLMLQAACTASVAVREPVVVVSRPPPPVRVEPPPPPPPGDPAVYVWQPGHWQWDGHDYDWHPGHYEKRPARTAQWVPAEWVEHNGQWEFRRGHWIYH